MCGICGKVSVTSDRCIDKQEIAAMCHQLQARGPDDLGVYVDGPVGLGSTRLSIIDLESGHMPLSNEDGSVWIAYNGEVYNAPQLRKQLIASGHVFSTATDTEVIVHLYEEFGDRFTEHLNGMFAVAIWDGRLNRLVLARDHLGIKPLYYYESNDELLFASEVKALLAAGIEREIDRTALHDYLSLNYVPGPRSLLSGVKKLLPGHSLTFDLATKKSSTHRFWDIPLVQRPTLPVGMNVEQELLTLLRQVVRDQLISDVPVGAFLSGGIDSSVVVALASEMTTEPLRTFSIGFRERSYDESPYARIVAEKYRTDHHELILEPDPVAIVQDMADYFDEPFADSSAVAVHAVSQLAAEHVKVVLSGDGGDEVFGGYATYQADQLARLYRFLPHTVGSGWIPRLVNQLPTSESKVSLDFKLKRFTNGASLPPLAAHVAWKEFFSESMKSRLYATDRFAGMQNARPTVSLMQDYFDRYDSDDLLNRLLYVDSKVQLVDDMLTKVDRMSMANSLEVRVPLLDVRLVEFMSQLPSSLKVSGMQLKLLLKKIARKLLPASILRRRKAGFHVPIPRWLKTDLREMVGDYLSRSMVERQGFFDPNEVERLLNDHARRRCDYSRNIWNLLMFSLWHERYFATSLQATS